MCERPNNVSSFVYCLEHLHCVKGQSQFEGMKGREFPQGGFDIELCRFLKPFSNIVWMNIKFNGTTFYFYPLNQCPSGFIRCPSGDCCQQAGECCPDDGCSYCQLTWLYLALVLYYGFLCHLFSSPSSFHPQLINDICYIYMKVDDGSNENGSNYSGPTTTDPKALTEFYPILYSFAHYVQLVQFCRF